MLVDIAFFHEAKMRAHRWRRHDFRYYPASATVSIPEVSSDDAPLAIRFGKLKHFEFIHVSGVLRPTAVDPEPELVELRLIEGRLFRPCYKGDGSADIRDAGWLRTVCADPDDPERPAALTPTKARPDRRMRTSYADDPSASRRVENPNLDVAENAIRTAVEAFVLIDGDLWQEVPEPTLTVAFECDNLWRAKIQFYPEPVIAEGRYLTFRLDQKEAAEHFIQSRGNASIVFPFIEILRQDALKLEPQDHYFFRNARHLSTLLEKVVETMTLPSDNPWAQKAKIAFDKVSITTGISPHDLNSAAKNILALSDDGAPFTAALRLAFENGLGLYRKIVALDKTYDHAETMFWFDYAHWFVTNPRGANDDYDAIAANFGGP